VVNRCAIHHEGVLLDNSGEALVVEFSASTWSEEAFVSEVLRRTGCGLLLDVNNLYVSAVNHGRDVHASLHALPLDHVGEIHLAGFATQSDSTGAPLLIDSHGAPVAQAVWDLYDHALALTGARPTLLERDNDIPAWPVLLAEAQLAEQRLQRANQPTRTPAHPQAVAA